MFCIYDLLYVILPKQFILECISLNLYYYSNTAAIAKHKNKIYATDIAVYGRKYALN